MRTELQIEWVGFTATERQRLQTLWSRVQFSTGFTARFRGSISKDSPGKGIFYFEANDPNFFREHFSGGLDFTDLSNLASLTAELARRFYDRLIKEGVIPAE